MNHRGFLKNPSFTRWLKWDRNPSRSADVAALRLLVASDPDWPWRTRTLEGLERHIRLHWTASGTAQWIHLLRRTYALYVRFLDNGGRVPSAFHEG